MHNVKVALVCAMALGGAAALSGASAMPADDLGRAAVEGRAGVKDVRMICGPGGCVWRPDYVPPPRFYGPPVRSYGYGYGPRPWRDYSYGPRRDYRYGYGGGYGGRRYGW